MKIVGFMNRFSVFLKWKVIHFFFCSTADFDWFVHYHVSNLQSIYSAYTANIYRGNTVIHKTRRPKYVKTISSLPSKIYKLRQFSSLQFVYFLGQMFFACRLAERPMYLSIPTTTKQPLLSCFKRLQLLWLSPVGIWTLNWQGQ